MRIVIEREVAKYKHFVEDFQEVLRHFRKYRALDESQAELINEMWDDWFDLKEAWDIKEDE